MAVSLVSLATVGAREVRAQQVTWTSSLQYSQGEYFFTETTRSWSLYTGFSVQGNRARLSLGFPLVVQNSRAITFVGDLPLPTGGPDSEAIGRRNPGDRVPMGGGGPRTAPLSRMVPYPPVAGQTADSPDTVEAPGDYRLELADPVITGGIEVVEPRGRFSGLDLSVSAKVPLRNLDSGVGTGELDAGVGLSSGVSVGGVLLLADAGWWSYGDPPGLELKDVVTWGVGAGALLGSRASGLVTLSGSSRIIAEAERPLDLTGLLSLTMSERVGLVLGFGLGLSEVSPDFTASVGARVSHGIR
jgi:hypothetical protein